MQLSFFSTISLSIIVASGLVAAREQNDFAATCGGFSLADGRFLFATCENFAGTGSDSTSIDLNGCVENFAGTLECALNGDYVASCSGCSLVDGSILACNCGTGNTLKDLNDCVSNTNGQLTCP